MDKVGWCSNVRSSETQYLTVPELQKLLRINFNPGFRTVFMFSEEDLLIQGKSRAGLGRLAAFSNELFIDIDTNDDAVSNKVKDKLIADKADFTMYFSGNKGKHFHIAIEEMRGKDVPFSQKTYAQELCSLVDVSIYRSSSLFRLPNTKHDKSGKRKELIFKHTGNLLKIPIVDVPLLQDFVCDVSNEAIALQHLLHVLEDPPSNGERYIKGFWSIAKHLAESGFSKDFVEESLTLINSKFDEPKEFDEISRALKEVFK